MPYQYIEAPNSPQILNNNSVFLAGGITGCVNWQQIAADKLSVLDTLTVINPRRAKWVVDKTDVAETLKQINWEYHGIRLATHIIFWFTKDTLQPIALFELGSALQRVADGGKQKIFLGVDPAYERLLDIKVQARLIGHGATIRADINELLDDFVNGYR